MPVCPPGLDSPIPSFRCAVAASFLSSLGIDLWGTNHRDPEFLRRIALFAPASSRRPLPRVPAVPSDHPVQPYAPPSTARAPRDPPSRPLSAVLSATAHPDPPSFAPTATYQKEPLPILQAAREAELLYNLYARSSSSASKTAAPVPANTPPVNRPLTKPVPEGLKAAKWRRVILRPKAARPSRP